MGKVTIVGIGVDGVMTLTAQGKMIIERSDILIGAKRMLEPFSPLGKTMFCEYRTDEIVRIITENKDKEIAALMSGDSGFFSGAERLYAELMKNGTKAETVCGISSVSYFASKIHLPWQEMKIVTLHGTSGNIVRTAARNRLAFFLLGGDITPQKLCRRLCEYGLENIRVHIGADLGYGTERIISGSASELSDCGTAGLCVLVTENDSPESGVRCGIPDTEFLRGSVPMTKSEVRSVIISKLSLPQKGVCWDIGCGTGSVSVEMALACHGGTVFSIDRNEEAVELTKQNAVRFHCDNICVKSGTAPYDLSDFPAPDSVFIGGAGGNIAAVLNAAYLLNKRVTAVITAVSLETLNEAVSAFEEQGIVPEIVQIAVTRTRAVGSHTMLSAENPIFIIKGVRL